MKINDFELISPPRPKGIFKKSARLFLISVLHKVQGAGLSLYEEGEVQQFGDPFASLQASVTIKDPRTYQMILSGGSLGGGEAYMLGYWDTPNLTKVIQVFALNMTLLTTMDSNSSFMRKITSKIFHRLRRNNIQQARLNISAHYDLSNDFFQLFLDPTLAYSSAIFCSPEDTLEQASRNKFERVCLQLQLSSHDHLLEIGTGWGGFAIHAAQNYGCRVTTTTLSKEQASHARSWIASQGLTEKVTVLEEDYRRLEGKYDKLVSIEMIEAVGHEYFSDYFATCCALLKPKGLMLLQAITISDQRYKASLRNIDFIKRYIFPGGQLPSIERILFHTCNDTDFQLVNMVDITHDYARTLRAWHENFENALNQVVALGFDEIFIRMWRFYLCFCEGGFLERAIHTQQFLFAKPEFRALQRINLTHES